MNSISQLTLLVLSLFRRGSISIPRCLSKNERAFFRAAGKLSDMGINSRGQAIFSPASCRASLCSWSAAHRANSAASTTFAGIAPAQRRRVAAIAKLFRCGYHGWTYGLDGALISAPEFEGVEDFRSEQFALVPVRTEGWSNLIFVNLDSNATPLMQSLGELPKQADRFGLSAMKLFERRTYDMKCNWKTYVDNYLEGYHLPSVHPGLNRELDYNAYTVETYARHVRQFSPIRGAQAGDATPRRYQEAREDLTTDYFWIFPNWMLNCYPDNVSLNIVLPLEVERTLAIFEWYLPEEKLGSQTAKDSVRFSDEIQIEDVKICETVQKNLHSRSYDRGRYSVKQERGVHAFHRMYAEAMKK